MLSVVIFFSSFINILYHLGIMQFVVQKIAWIMQKTMQTAATESLIAASNIFIGQVSREKGFEEIFFCGISFGLLVRRL